MPFYLSQNAFSSIEDGYEFEDTNDNWEKILSQEPVVLPTDTDKLQSLAVCAGQYKVGATSRHKKNIEFTHGLVMDVDNWTEAGIEPFTLDDIKARLEGFRFIAWTTWRSRTYAPRWRVVIPFASPLPVKRHSSLFKTITEVFSGAVSNTQADPSRLGFLGSVNAEEGISHYVWHIQNGERLDWSNIELVEEDEVTFLSPANAAFKPEKSPEWSSEDEAFASAKRYFRRVGEDVEEGSRHATLLNVSIACWWKFALEEAHVRQVLQIVNANFAEPKGDEHIENELRAGYERVFGENRVDQPEPYGIEREPPERISKTAIKELAVAYNKKARDGSRAVARALKAVADGSKLCEPIEARAVTFAVADTLARQYAREKPERIMDMMAQSLSAQRAYTSVHNVPSDEEIAAKIRWSQNAARKSLEQREAERIDVQRNDISVAFAKIGIERDDPYTIQEVRRWESVYGFRQDHWIVVAQDMYYCWIGGTFVGPFSKAVASVFVPKYLAPAKDFVTTHYIDTKDGKLKSRPLDELVREYGVSVSQIVKDLSVGYSCIKNDALIISCGRPRDIAPAFSKRVDGWLRAFAGGVYPNLVDWLSQVMKTNKPLSALVLVGGAANTGKTLLQLGITRVWSETLVKLGDIQSYALCPVVTAAHSVPKEWSDRYASTLRDFLDANARTVKFPYEPPTTLAGYQRIVLAGRNIEAVFAVENLVESSSLNVLEDCILLVHVDDSAAAFLSTFDAGSDAFKEEIAAHIKWLDANHNVGTYSNSRYGAHSANDLSMLQIVSGAAPALAVWTVQALYKGDVTNDAVIKYDNTFWVAPSIVADFLGKYVFDTRGLTPHKLVRLGGYVVKDSRRIRHQKRGRVRYYRIDMDVLGGVAEKLGIAAQDLRQYEDKFDSRSSLFTEVESEDDSEANA